MRVSEEVYEVSLSWGERLLEVRLLPARAAPTWADLPFEAAALFAGEGYERAPLFVEAAGEVRLTHPAEQRSVRISSGERVELRHGLFTLSVRGVQRPAAAAGSALRDCDFSFFKLASMTGLAAAALVLMLLLPPEVDAATDPFFGRRPTALFVVEPPKPPIVEVTPPEAPTIAVPTGAEPVPTMRRPTAGGGNPLQKALSIFGGGAISSVISNSRFGDAMAQADSLSGPASASSDGIAGLESRGTRPGVGGGPGGIGSVGTQRVPAGAFSGLTRPGANLGRVTPATPERTHVVGGLDRDTISKVIRSHESQIKFCYEQELARDPTLSGKLAVLFVIDSAGAVSVASVAESSLGSSAVETCVVSRIRRWKFPEPRGGGEVHVNYPWILRPAGSGE